MSGKGKNFVHMARDMFLLRVCFQEIVDRNMPLCRLINVGTAVGQHSPYDIFWHNRLVRDELYWWGGRVVNPVPVQSLRTGRDRSTAHMPVSDSRHRHHQANQAAAVGQLVPEDQEPDEEPIREV